MPTYPQPSQPNGDTPYPPQPTDTGYPPPADAAYPPPGPGPYPGNEPIALWGENALSALMVDPNDLTAGAWLINVEASLHRHVINARVSFD